MTKKESSLEKSRKRAEAALDKTNAEIEELGGRSARLSDNLGAFQSSFDKIRNVPEEKRREFERVKKVRLDWKQQVEVIEADYVAVQAKNVGEGVAGAGAGIAIAALAPTAAMPTTSSRSCHAGPAQYSSPSTHAYPRLSALALTHLTASNGVPGSASIAARSSLNASGVGMPFLSCDPALISSQPSRSMYIRAGT